MELVIATNNRSKAGELLTFLEPLRSLLSLTFLGTTEQFARTYGLDQPPVPTEDGDTYIDNAKSKAEAIGCWSGRPTLADDSGLEVVALNGGPGVHSAHFGGNLTSSERNQLLLTELAGVIDRRARLVATLCLRLGPGCYLVTEGSWSGTISLAPAGAGGWGYEPVFIPCGEQETAATLRQQGRALVTHREEAARSLVATVAALRAGRCWLEGGATLAPSS